MFLVVAASTVILSKASVVGATRLIATSLTGLPWATLICQEVEAVQGRFPSAPLCDMSVCM